MQHFEPPLFERHWIHDRLPPYHPRHPQNDVDAVEAAAVVGGDAVVAVARDDVVDVARRRNFDDPNDAGPLPTRH
jgi:hypothetical protein